MSDHTPSQLTPAAKEAADQALVLADSYTNYAVTTESEYLNGAAHLRDIKTRMKAIEEERTNITRPMDAAKKAVMDFFRPATQRLADAEDNVKRAMGTYSAEQKRIADEQARIEREKADKEAARLREEARKADELAAKKERERLAREQEKADKKAAEEQERIEAERAAAKSAEDQRRVDEQEAAAKRRREEEQERMHQQRLDAEAAQRERTARAESLESRADSVTAAPLAPSTPKVKGVSTRQTWKFEVTHPEKVPDTYKTIDDKKIGGVVRALKGDTDIPGVRVWAEDAVSVRTK